ncbi:hypothetical protein Patl1_02308 [Pistacia atlantica]|uniref:Uncharacterized protein n=1 Tax=Pistacia atlantica TaxID=434234 RepID=A0ACC1CDE5_9ROSI|nr:hypothetical protein Patl1_02308 [Pistacia atlantica]
MNECDVVYYSNPTSPGDGYRSAVGRLFFKAKEMGPVVEALDIVKNSVSFTALGFLDGEVSFKVGGLEFQYGAESEVKLHITCIDEKIRLGLGSEGSLFVFQRYNERAAKDAKEGNEGGRKG